MVQLQADIEKIQDAGIRLAGISYDPPEVLRKFVEQNKITFPLLSDPDSKAIDAYTLRNKEAREGSRQEGIPHPVTILLGKEGVVRAKLAYNVSRRHTTQELIEAAGKITSPQKE